MREMGLHPVPAIEKLADGHAGRGRISHVTDPLKQAFIAAFMSWSRELTLNYQVSTISANFATECRNC